MGPDRKRTPLTSTNKAKEDILLGSERKVEIYRWPWYLKDFEIEIAKGMPYRTADRRWIQNECDETRWSRGM